MRIGFVGWRGMVGSVLINRMIEEDDFKKIEPVFFSSSNAGGKSPDIKGAEPLLQDAFDIKKLADLKVIVSCFGGDYTKKVYKKIRSAGWKGYWIDAASALRLDKKSIIVLDPVNKKVINKGLETGIKTFVGGNCTVSLMLMALSGLFKSGYIEWLSTMTYQSASGAGAKNMTELIKQTGFLCKSAEPILNNPAATAIELDQLISEKIESKNFPIKNFGAPLACSLIPWIDSGMESGQTKEEWKGFVETNKILKANPPIPIDGICVRVGVMRCHSQAVTIKLNKNIPIADIIEIIKNGNNWVKIIPNQKASTLESLTPAAVSGKLTVPIGRIRKMSIGDKYLTAFTVGDQLLWGAAEPLRRALKIIIRHISG